MQGNRRVGGMQHAQEFQQRGFVVRRLFRLTRGQKPAVQKLIDRQNRRVEAADMRHRPSLERGGIPGAKIFVEEFGRRQYDLDARNARHVLHKTAAGRSAVQRYEQYTAYCRGRRRRNGNGAFLLRRGAPIKRAGQRGHDDKDRYEPSPVLHSRASFSEFFCRSSVSYSIL